MRPTVEDLEELDKLYELDRIYDQEAELAKLHEEAELARQAGEHLSWEPDFDQEPEGEHWHD